MAAKPIEQWDSESVVYEHNDIETEHDGNLDTREGYVATPQGFVRVYSTWWPDGTKHTRLTLIYGGRQYERSISNYYQPRYLVTLAKKFAADIAELEAHAP